MRRKTGKRPVDPHHRRGWQDKSSSIQLLLSTPRNWSSIDLLQKNHRGGLCRSRLHLKRKEDKVIFLNKYEDSNSEI